MPELALIESIKDRMKSFSIKLARQQINASSRTETEEAY